MPLGGPQGGVPPRGRVAPGEGGRPQGGPPPRAGLPPVRGVPNGVAVPPWRGGRHIKGEGGVLTHQGPGRPIGGVHLGLVLLWGGYP